VFYKKVILSVVLIAGLSLYSFAQQAVATAGGNASGSGGTAGYTIGQTVYVAVEGTGGTVTPGIQQSFEISAITGINESPNFEIAVYAYPNPTSDDLKLTITGNEIAVLSFQLFNMKGELIQSRRIENHVTVINMKELPSALYILKITQVNKEIKAFNIIKN
jgi:hypothetical protein